MITYVYSDSKIFTTTLLRIDIFYVQGCDQHFEGWYWSYHGDDKCYQIDKLIYVKYEQKKVLSLDVANYIAFSNNFRLIGQVK